MSSNPMKSDPSLSSYYVGDDFYQTLVDNFSGWQNDEAEITDMAVRDSCRRLLEKEARLLDEYRLDDWLTLWKSVV